jgi:hypothetical protein
VPGEGFEPPAFGLQNRCTTTVLTRHFNDSSRLSGLANTSLAGLQIGRTERCNWPALRPAQVSDHGAEPYASGR